MSAPMTHVFNELQRALACAVDAEPDLMHGVGQLFWHGVLRAVSAVCGTHVLAYTARATTPGTFVAAPAKAEEMYAPETFGRSAATVVVVE